MRNIHQFFEESHQDRIRRATIERGRSALCWYPSAGTDFRHIPLIEKERFSSDCPSQPMVYLHTDMRLPKKHLKSFDLLAQGDLVAPDTKVVSISEIRPKKMLLDVSREVYYWGADKDTGKVYLIDLLMSFAHRGCLVQVPIPVLYFIAENLAFLVHLLLQYQMRINTLIHIRDGGASMGESRVPMNFIYQVSSILRLKRVICDASPESKCFYTRTDFSVLFEEIESMKYRHPEKSPLWSFQEYFVETPVGKIRSAWSGCRIERDRLAPNGYTLPDGCYYDWRKSASQVENSEPDIQTPAIL